MVASGLSLFAPQEPPYRFARVVVDMWSMSEDCNAIVKLSQNVSRLFVELGRTAKCGNGPAHSTRHVPDSITGEQNARWFMSQTDVTGRVPGGVMQAHAARQIYDLTIIELFNYWYRIESTDSESTKNST